MKIYKFELYLLTIFAIWHLLQWLEASQNAAMQSEVVQSVHLKFVLS